MEICKQKKITTKVSMLIFILICSIALTCCTKTNKIPDKPQSILLNMGEKQINIEDETDVFNIYSIIQTMKVSSQVNEAEQGIKGELIFNKNNKQNITFGENYIILDGKAYEGIEKCVAIKNILNKYIYDKKYLIEAVEKSDVIQLFANDISDNRIFTDKEKSQLITTLNSMDIRYMEPTGAPIVSDFPDYSLQLCSKNKENVYTTIYIPNSDLINVAGNTISIYSTGDDLWKMASSLIIPHKFIDKANPSYLFNAKKVELNDGLEYGLGSGEYTNRLLWIVRLLKDGELAAKNTIENKKLTLIFTKENEAYEVTVYKEGFVYNNKFYNKPNVLDEIISMLLAG